MRHLLKYFIVLSVPGLLGGCATDCFDWRCPLDATSVPKYERFLQTQNTASLEFGAREYRYQLVQWIGEKHFETARQSNAKADYDRFLDYYQSVEQEAGSTLVVYAEIARARSSGTTAAVREPEPIFSRDDALPKILPITPEAPDAQALIAANPLISKDQTVASTESAGSGFVANPDSPLSRDIASFVDDPEATDASEKDLKSLLGAAAARGDFKTAFEGLMNFAKREHPDAQFLVGRMLEDGIGVDQNYQSAIDWFEKSANLGSDRARTALLGMYDVGLGAPTDAPGRFNWHMRAAEQGHPAAQTQLGIYYEKGEGTQKDLNEAAKWYQQAARQGDANAQFLLGWMYAEGQGVELDYIEAYSWFSQAKAHGIAEAHRLMQMILGEMSAEQAASARKRADQRASNLRG